MVRDANVLEQAVQACEHSFAEWCHAQFATTTLLETARLLSASLPAVVTSFGLSWNIDVVTDEITLNGAQVKSLRRDVGSNAHQRGASSRANYGSHRVRGVSSIHRGCLGCCLHPH